MEKLGMIGGVAYDAWSVANKINKWKIPTENINLGCGSRRPYERQKKASKLGAIDWNVKLVVNL